MGVPRPCTVEGCERLTDNRRLCAMHAKRLQKRGDVGGAGLERAANGSGSVHNAGYWRFHLPNHPIADSRGTVLRHRLVLYEKLEGQNAPCHWCQTPVEWGVSLEADHVDHNRTNDEPSNLVPSCHGCNVRRRPGGEKLTAAQVAVIRTRRSSGETLRSIADDYGVSAMTVSQIARGKTWATR